jgi:hypothetical protein
MMARTVNPASGLISARIAELGDWRGDVLRRVRKLIKQADAGIVEEWKWDVPVWSHDGIVCTGEAYKKAVKLTFAKGAALEDPAGLFNSSLEGKVRRAIDIHEGDEVDERAFKELIRAAVALNAAKPKTKPAKKAAKKPAHKAGAKPVLLSGGNPQIAKGDGDAPVQAYIKAIPGWKRNVARQVDALVVRTVPAVRKAVKWNSPFYGAEEGWFLSFHCFTKYVKVAFFRGVALRPPPPGESKHKEVRYLDLYEDEPLDEAQFTAWVKQASRLPGEKL